MRRTIPLAGVVALAALAVAIRWSPSITASGCGGCYEGSCPCADGVSVRGTAVPCECPKLCASHGGECKAANRCATDAGDAENDAAEEAGDDAEVGDDAATIPVDAPIDSALDGLSNEGG